VIDERELLARLVEARDYVYQLASARSTSWQRLKDEHDQGTLEFPRTLVMVHPVWYQHLEDDTSPASVRGGRTFKLGDHSGRCQSDELWGYPCPFQGAALHVDHLFPYSLGGPTEPDNAAWLCEWHNMTKGSDFHLLALGRATAPWFERVLVRVETKLAGRARPST